jgi:Cytochrome c554 and c-prime
MEKRMIVGCCNGFKFYLFALFLLLAVILAIDTNFIFSNQDAEDPCYFCHVDLIFEMKDGPHESAGIFCRECHGESDDHVFVEDNSIKPDKVIKLSDTGEFCGSCHENEYRNYQLSSHSGGTQREGKKSPTCTTCHSAHGKKSKKMILDDCIECHCFEGDKQDDETVHRINKSELLLYNFHSLQKK